MEAIVFYVFVNAVKIYKFKSFDHVSNLREIYKSTTFYEEKIRCPI